MRLYSSFFVICASVFAAAPEFDRAVDLYNHTEYEASLKLLLPLSEKSGGELVLIGQNYYMLGDAKRATDEDGPVRPHEVKLVHRLHRESRCETAFGGLGRCQSDHVRRYVRTVDVEPSGEKGNEYPTITAPNIERRLSKFPDRGSVVGQLIGLGAVELHPPAGDQTVVPSPRLGLRQCTMSPSWAFQNSTLRVRHMPPHSDLPFNSSFAKRRTGFPSLTASRSIRLATCRDMAARLRIENCAHKRKNT